MIYAVGIGCFYLISGFGWDPMIEPTQNRVFTYDEYMKKVGCKTDYGCFETMIIAQNNKDELSSNLRYFQLSKFIDYPMDFSE